MPADPFIEVTHQKGSIHLPGVGLWLDPHGKAEAAFISHAHSDHVGRHKLTFCTSLTHQLMQARMGKLKGEIIPLEFGEVKLWNDHELRLLPAGHVIGSAMLHLTRLSDGATLLYTGDYKLRQGLTTPAAQLLQADTLIMETTFGLPQFVFPPIEQVIASTLMFARETLAAGGTPVLLGYSLGKAQEILALLRGADLPVMLHDSVMKLMDICAPAMGQVPEHRAFNADEAAGHVLICPPMGSRSEPMRKLKDLRTAMFTGWALQAGAKYRYRVDVLFPLSDHADYVELWQTVEQVQPKRVFTVHGYTREFSADLRRRGHEAWSLERDDQLELMLLENVTAQPETAR